MEARSDSVVEEGESEPKCSCRCCACCGSKAKGWLLLFFALLAVLFAVGALASPWYFVYDETADATVNTYYRTLFASPPHELRCPSTAASLTSACAWACRVVGVVAGQ
jgi:hypothetical protein